MTIRITKIVLMIASTWTLVACGSKGNDSSSSMYDQRYNRMYDGRYGVTVDAGTGYNAYSDTDLTLAVAQNGTVMGDMFVGVESVPGCYVPYGRYDLSTYQSPGYYNYANRTLQGGNLIADRGDVQLLINIQYATYTDPYKMAAQIQIVNVNGMPCKASMFFGMW